MNTITLLLAVLAASLALGLAVWMWLAINSANDDMRSFARVAGMHLEL